MCLWWQTTHSLERLIKIVKGGTDEIDEAIVAVEPLVASLRALLSLQPPAGPGVQQRRYELEARLGRWRLKDSKSRFVNGVSHQFMDRYVSIVHIWPSLATLARCFGGLATMVGRIRRTNSGLTVNYSILVV